MFDPSGRVLVKNIGFNINQPFEKFFGPSRNQFAKVYTNYKFEFKETEVKVSIFVSVLIFKDA